ncbi:hypothetical protein EUGRSUZ_J02043 [Eucalyptus grandis]|uniref:Uncharacterized protein n=2 Tax=Eucalyptus grandis TaxID=71139 RepID=A0ACC3J899_EUCGR|nr:hypothetical protein EUGRSUZ_J02043 [Eucalyptus grandis]
MIMEPRVNGFSGSPSALMFDNETLLPFPDQRANLANGFGRDGQSRDVGFVDKPFFPSDPRYCDSAPSSLVSVEADFPSEDSDFSETVFRYINQMLLEEDMEEKSSMSHNPLALQAVEKSLHEALGETCRSEATPSPPFMESPDNNYLGNSNDYGKSSPSRNTGGSNFADHQWLGDFGDGRNYMRRSSDIGDFIFQSTVNAHVQPSSSLPNSFLSNGNRTSASLGSGPLFSNFLTGSQSVLQFQRGVEEASKFLPKVTQLFIDLEKSSVNSWSKEKKSLNVVNLEEDESDILPLSGIRGKKNHQREDSEFENERSNKQTAVYVDDTDTELSEMIDKLLLFKIKNRSLDFNADESSEKEVNESLQQSRQTRTADGCKFHNEKPTPTNNVTEMVDLRTLLILCAQAVSSDDRRTADDYLKQIRQHASPFGDGSQRLAHYFVDGLEARLGGTGSQVYLGSKKTSAVDILKAHQVCHMACPFQKMANVFASYMITDLAEKATTLHIIDFGILYGFQRPVFIFILSRRTGGPPKLRITGIEFPQRGFRPAERVQETGRHLAKLCKQFNVPFEYNAIAQEWDTIKIGDLKIRNGETIAVNTMFRFKNLLDETVVLNNPKDSVLNLIRKIRPHLFVQAIVNGSFSVPFFVTRFREALFHYSSLFDAFDTNLERDNQMRLTYEKEFFGREAINVIAYGPDSVLIQGILIDWAVLVEPQSLLR